MGTLSEETEGAQNQSCGLRRGVTANHSAITPNPSPTTGAARRGPPERASVALVGNPNTGKTSLFNALTGFRRHIANYPGVTVDAARGPLRGTQRPIEVIDLPGTYSLAALAPDELLVVNLACGRIAGQPAPDAILAVVDASNLPRNLYLVSQVLELGLPTVVALNMIDVAEARGIRIDHELLSERLGVPVVPVVATRQTTVRPLLEVLERALVRGSSAPEHSVLPRPLYTECDALRDGLPGGLTRAEALRVLLDRDGEAESQYLARGGSRERLDAARQRLAAAGLDGQVVETRARYAWIARILEGVIHRPERPVVTWSDRLDRVLTHRLAGGLALVLVLLALFQSIFAWSLPLMDAIDAAFAALGEHVAALLPEGAASSLIVDGVIAGVGGVLVFLPQILILFAFIAVLEDCGYMARAAYMMDRVMRAAGLSGRAFIPLLSSFACAVPAIMGTRTIADRRERFVTILIAPFMSCSARLPVYVLLISTFVPPTGYLGGWISLQTLVMMGMYLVGVVAAVPIAWLLRNTVLAGAGGGFILELPSYKLPRPRAIWQRMYLAGRGFIVRAGTVILLVNLVVWALGYFPRGEQTRAAVESRAAAEAWDEARHESELAGAYLRESYLGRMGRAIEPLIRPIGWDWRVGVAVIASFPAREVVIATLGTIFNLGAGADEQSESLRSAIRSATWPDGQQPIFTLPVALSIMVFFALCAQCASTLVVIGRETGSWLWPLASFVGMTTIAYLAAWGTAAAARAMGL